MGGPDVEVAVDDGGVDLADAGGVAFCEGELLPLVAVGVDGDAVGLVGDRRRVGGGGWSADAQDVHGLGERSAIRSRLARLRLCLPCRLLCAVFVGLNAIHPNLPVPFGVGNWKDELHSTSYWGELLYLGSGGWRVVSTMRVCGN